MLTALPIKGTRLTAIPYHDIRFGGSASEFTPTHTAIALPSTVPLPVSVRALSGKNGAYIHFRAISIMTIYGILKFNGCQEEIEIIFGYMLQLSGVVVEATIRND